MLDYLDISCLRSTYWLYCCGINYCVSACKCVMVTAAQKIIKNSNHSYVRNVLHIKLVKLQSIWKSGSGVNLNSCMKDLPAMVFIEQPCATHATQLLTNYTTSPAAPKKPLFPYTIVFIAVYRYESAEICQHCYVCMEPKQTFNLLRFLLESRFIESASHSMIIPATMAASGSVKTPLMHHQALTFDKTQYKQWFTAQ